MIYEMTSEAIREKLHDIINTANDNQLQSIYSLFDDQLGEPYTWWEDEEFVAELEQRVKDIETGIDKGVTWDEIKKKTQLYRQSK